VSIAIVILGNGAVGHDGVYRISGRCLRLVAEAERLAGQLDLRAVVFTGGRSEAEQMREAWRGPVVELVLEPTARRTAENASRTLPLLRERGIETAVVVCGRTHSVRARFFFTRIYGAAGIDTRLHVVGRLPRPTEVAWEVVAFPLRRRHLAMARRELERR
jgi:uncharacterized SAM-binding protein YcdF (DUF218 family)